MEAKSFEDLTLWQKSMNLVEEVYKISSLFPKEEIYGLTSQIRRAAVSIPSNIAEGNTRQSVKEFNHFLTIAQGSLAELKTQLFIAQRLKYVANTESIPILALIEEVTKMLYGLKRFLKSNI